MTDASKLQQYPILFSDSLLFPYGQRHFSLRTPRELATLRAGLHAGKEFLLAIVDANDKQYPEQEEIEFRIVPLACVAKIIDFDCQPDGCLHLALESCARFEISDNWQTAERVFIGSGRRLANPAKVAPEAEFKLFVDILRKTAASGQLELYCGGSDYADAFWVLGRMVDILKLPAPLQLKLLLMDDANAALKLLLETLISNRVQYS